MTGTIKSARSRLRIGDVLEIKTPHGFAYVQVSHEHPMYGDLIRVLPGLYQSLPDLGELAQSPHLWVTFFPAKVAVSRGIVRNAGNYPLPRDARAFPAFRIGGLPDPKTNAISRWSRWDGWASQPIAHMGREDWSLPPLETINDTLLIERIVSGWRPEHEEQFESGLRARGELRDDAGQRREDRRHFLHFPSEASARNAAARLLTDGLPADVRHSSGSNEWAIVVSSFEDIPETRARLERIADEFGGSYDGWEAQKAASPVVPRN